MRSGDEESEVIDNGIIARLDNVYATKGELNGLFTLKNLFIGNNFYNIDIYVDKFD